MHMRERFGIGNEEDANLTLQERSLLQERMHTVYEYCAFTSACCTSNQQRPVPTSDSINSIPLPFIEQTLVEGNLSRPGVGCHFRLQRFHFRSSVLHQSSAENTSRIWPCGPSVRHKVVPYEIDHPCRGKGRASSHSSPTVNPRLVSSMVCLFSRRLLTI